MEYHQLYSVSFPVQLAKEEVELMLINPHDAFRGQPMTLNVVPFNILHMFSYWCATITLSTIYPPPYTCMYMYMLVDSSRGRKVKREKRPRNDWQVRPTHSRRAATAPGKIVTGCGDKYGGIL